MYNLWHDFILTDVNSDYMSTVLCKYVFSFHRAAQCAEAC